MPSHQVLGAGKPISVTAGGRDGSRNPGRRAPRASLGRGKWDASGAGCRFGIDVVVVSESAMRARYCVEGAESLGD
ncbi:MAG: hypothetical protein ABI355_07510 [Solirubrobacteraceae bacterium]